MIATTDTLVRRKAVFCSGCGRSEGVAGGCEVAGREIGGFGAVGKCCPIGAYTVPFPRVGVEIVGAKGSVLGRDCFRKEVERKSIHTPTPRVRFRFKFTGNC